MNFNENKLEEQTTNPDSVPKKKKIQTQINWNSLKHSPTHNKHKPNYTKINPNQTNQPIKINQRINLNQVINPQIWKCENNYKNRPKNQRESTHKFRFANMLKHVHPLCTSNHRTYLGNHHTHRKNQPKNNHKPSNHLTNQIKPNTHRQGGRVSKFRQRGRKEEEVGLIASRESAQSQ